MEVKELKKIFSQQRSITLLRDYLGNYDNYTVEIAGLSGSSKSLAFSCTVDEGIHIIVLNTKEEAQYFCADLYNFTESEKVFFFPSSHTSTTSITTIKESSQRVQRSATINAINKYMCGEEGMSGYLIIVTYPAAVEEKILKSDDVKKNLLKISKGDHLSHEFIKETLLSYKFEKVDFVGEPGQFAFLVASTVLMSVNYVVWVLAGQFLLSYKAGLFPVWGYRSGFYLVLPVAIGILSSLGVDIRFFRTAILDEIYKPYVLTARAKGLSRTAILVKHVLRNALIPIVTSVSLSIPYLFPGSLLLESFFGIPGLGSVAINAIHSSDMAVVRSVVVLGALLYQFVNLVTDLLYAALDPRVRFT